MQQSHIFIIPEKCNSTLTLNHTTYGLICTLFWVIPTHTTVTISKSINQEACPTHYFTAHLIFPKYIYWTPFLRNKFYYLPHSFFLHHPHIWGEEGTRGNISVQCLQQHRCTSKIQHIIATTSEKTSEYLKGWKWRLNRPSRKTKVG